MKKSIPLLCASLLLPVSALLAVDGEQILQKGDTDKDGKVSEAEFSALLPNDPDKAEKRFKRIDQDGDGYASLEELKVFYDPK